MAFTESLSCGNVPHVVLSECKHFKDTATPTRFLVNHCAVIMQVRVVLWDNTRQLEASSQIQSIALDLRNLR